MATGQLANLRRSHLGEGPGSGQQPRPAFRKPAAIVHAPGSRAEAKGTLTREAPPRQAAGRKAPAARIAHAPGSRAQSKGSVTHEAPAPRQAAAPVQGTSPPAAVGQLANLRRAHLGEGGGSGQQPKPGGGQAPLGIGGGGSSAAPRALQRAESQRMAFRKAGPPRAPRTVLRDLPPRPAIPREKPREGAVTTMAYAPEEPPVYERSVYRSPAPEVDQWPHGEMVDMGRTPEEIREKTEEMTAPAPLPMVPQYPYGLSICLNTDELEKLGIEHELPVVGDILEFFAAAKVTCASASEKIDPLTGQAEACLRVELQICEMAIHEEEPEEVDEIEEEEARGRDRRQRFYGGDGEAMRDYDDDDD